MPEPSSTRPAAAYARFRVQQATPELAAFADGYGFAFDDYQREACAHLEAGSGVLVAAPTGAGKTIVGEFAVFLALQRGQKCFYTTPIKALSNQKYADLVRRHGAANVGLLTGDSSINSEAPVVVMTTEVLRNMIYAGSRTLDNLGFVVMDEVHYLADRFRGAVWEEVIIGLAESISVVALSATVSNAEEFGDWLSEVRGEMAVVVSERRPVPLFQHVLVGQAAVRPVRGRRADRDRAARRRQARGESGAGAGQQVRDPLRPGRLPPTPGSLRPGQAQRRRTAAVPTAARRTGPATTGRRTGPARWAPSTRPGHDRDAGRRRRCCRRSSSSSPGSAATRPSARCCPRPSG